jgi:hypothetical protein
VEGLESTEAREPQQMELSIDEGDDDSTRTTAASEACAEQRRKAEAACQDEALICRERARSLRCQAP